MLSPTVIYWDMEIKLFFFQQKHKHLHFLSFLHTDMKQVVEIFPHVRQGST